jgi:5-methylcytosine-specific restriction endonuclease McrA
MQTIDMKVCITCNEQKPATLEYFHKQGKSLRTECKPCKNLRTKAYAKANPEKEKARKKAYRESNPDKAQAAIKAWQKANPDKVKASGKAYREANPDKVKARKKAWQKANPDKLNGYNHKKRALKKSNEYSPYTEQEVLETYGFNCYLCDMPIDLNAPRKIGKPGWRTGLHIEHFIAISNGGGDTLENTRPSHGWCNLSKGVLNAY